MKLSDVWQSYGNEIKTKPKKRRQKIDPRSVVVEGFGQRVKAEDKKDEAINELTEGIFIVDRDYSLIRVPKEGEEGYDTLFDFCGAPRNNDKKQSLYRTAIGLLVRKEGKSIGIANTTAIWRTWSLRPSSIGYAKDKKQAFTLDKKPSYDHQANCESGATADKVCKKIEHTILPIEIAYEKVKSACNEHVEFFIPSVSDFMFIGKYWDEIYHAYDSLGMSEPTDAYYTCTFEDPGSIWTFNGFGTREFKSKRMFDLRYAFDTINVISVLPFFVLK